MRAEEMIKALKKAGFRIQQFDDYHHRVNGEVDFWLNGRFRHLSFHDRITGARGSLTPHQLFQSIKSRLESPREELAVTREEFMQSLFQIGWGYEEAENAWEDRKKECGVNANPERGI